MRCPRCEIEVSEHQKFCHECGTNLSSPEGGPEHEAVDDEVTAAPADEPTEPVETIETVEADEPTEPVEAIQTIEAVEPTEPVDAVQTVDRPTAPADVTDAVDVTEPEAPDAAPGAEATTGAEDPTERIEAVASVDDADRPTEPVELVLEPPRPDAQPAAAPEGFGPPVTAEMPMLFDGEDDLAEYPVAREPFQIRVIFLLAVFGAAAMLMTILADVIDLRTTRPAPGIATGPRTLEDLGSNLGLAGFVGAAVMVLGGLLACFGLRWGAGLAGGAGLALAGWSALSIGLAELPIAIAESITRTSSLEFTLRITRDLGWWLILGVGVIGVIVFLASLRSIGTGGQPALNPMVAAITAVAAVILAFGPLVPVNDAVFADNFRSVDPTRDLPAAFFAGRLGQVGLIALAGVVGMLIVRSYGLGLAAGGISVSAWLWISSLAEIGSAPVGIADRNPGADDTVPHAVTTVGMVATLLLLVVAAVLAIARLTRSRA